jgi:hypothetical protein
MLTKPPTYAEARESTPSSPQTSSASGLSGANGGDAVRCKIPWTTPRLVEIEVTPEERAELERSPAYVAPSDVALIPEGDASQPDGEASRAATAIGEAPALLGKEKPCIVPT